MKPETMKSAKIAYDGGKTRPKNRIVTSTNCGFVDTIQHNVSRAGAENWELVRINGK